jgi:hypothetical protein
MRVVHVCPFIGEQLGGSERYVVNLSKIQSESYDIYTAIPSSKVSIIGISNKDNTIGYQKYDDALYTNYGCSGAVLVWSTHCEVET